MNRRPVPILMAEDDEDDRLLAMEAFEESKLLNKLYIVEDGEELLDFLYHRGAYTDIKTSPEPGIILLDLNMPKKDGREAIKEIKADPHLRLIPVVVLTTSKEEEDIYTSYQLGISSFIVKPVTFEGLITVIQSLSRYWFEIVELPAREY
ncbi:response regulator [Okeania sp. SIO1I7]|uniref:response regulator n=1 Tax=Okeania sp. SIO1I7 TaxID=2607772 RepID=UPI0034562790